MPDAPVVTTRVLPRIAGLVLVVAGAAGLIASAFLTWFVATPDLGQFGAGSDVHADITGTGDVTISATGAGTAADTVRSSGNEVITTNAAWAGWAVVGIAVAAVIVAGLAAFGPARLGRPLAAVTAAAGVGALGVAAYALLVPVGRQTVRIAILDIGVETTAGIGPYVVIGAAVAVLLGAVALFLGRRSAPTPVAAYPPVPGPPFAPTAAVPPQPQLQLQQVPPPLPTQQVPAPSTPGAPNPGAEWARPAEQHTVVLRSAPAPAPPAPAPDDQTRTAVAPVAQRRPQPDWDRDWPGALPAATGAPVPSEQHTQVVKRPPRPTKVSPKPETEAIPRRDPRFDGPTQPM